MWPLQIANELWITVNYQNKSDSIGFVLLFQVLPGSRGHCDFTGSKADQGGFHLKGHKGEARKIAEEVRFYRYHMLISI